MGDDRAISARRRHRWGTDLQAKQQPLRRNIVGSHYPSASRIFQPLSVTGIFTQRQNKSFQQNGPGAVRGERQLSGNAIQVFSVPAASRAPFVVSSPDPPDVQQAFAAARGWKLPMVSHHDTTFAADTGYVRDDGRWRPGDDFCTLWHFFDLLPDGAAGWSPKFSYA